MKEWFLIQRTLIAGAFVLAAAPAYAADTAPAVETAAAMQSETARRALDEATTRVLAVGANSENVESLVSRIDESRLPTATVSAWLENAARLGEDDLPLNVVLSFYVQSVAKGYPVEQIENRVSATEHRLREAATLVDAVAPGVSKRDPSRLDSIDHTAWVLSLPGVSKDEVARSLTLAREESAPAEAAQAPVLTLGMLVASGLSTETSFDVVNAAWTKGYRGEPLERLGKALAEANPSGGAPPAQLVSEVMALLNRESSQDRFFDGLDELMDREGYRLPSMQIDDDPLNLRNRKPAIKDPVRSDNERPGIGG